MKDCLWLGLTAAVGFTKYLPKMLEKVLSSDGTFFLFIGIKLPRQQMPSREVEDYLISCSKASNSGVLKNSPRVISKASHNFLIVTLPGF